MTAQHGRQLLASFPFKSNSGVTSSYRRLSRFSRAESWTCAPCRARLAKSSLATDSNLRWQRNLSYTSVRRAEEPTSAKTPGLSESLAKLQQEQRDSSARAEATATAKDDQLPSHMERRRWQLSKRAQTIMDDVLAKASRASHQLNSITGTDYSGIEALRQSIIDQGITRLWLLMNSMLIPAQNKPSGPPMPQLQLLKRHTPQHTLNKLRAKKRWLDCWNVSSHGLRRI